MHCNLAYWYRITPGVHPPPDEEVTEVRGVVAPGIQIYPRRDVLVEASIQIPVVQSIDDALGNRRWRLLLAVKFLF